MDLEKEKKRVRGYIKRINTAYTQILFDRLKTDITKLAKHGYKVSQSKGKVSILKEIPKNSKVVVEYDGKLKITY